MSDKKARDFYLDMGGDYANNIVELGNEYDLVSARMQLKSMVRKGSSGSRKSSKSDSSQGAGLNPIKHFAQASWKNKIMIGLLVLIF